MKSAGMFAAGAVGVMVVINFGRKKSPSELVRATNEKTASRDGSVVGIKLWCSSGRDSLQKSTGEKKPPHWTVVFIEGSERKKPPGLGVACYFKTSLSD